MTVAISIDGLTVRFSAPTPLRERLRRERRTLAAVLDVTLAVEAGSSVGIVGESGSGKTTVARTICGLQPATSGAVTINASAPERGRSRPRVQMVFQDPTSSLDPRQRVRDIIGEVLRVHHIVPRNRVDARVEELAAQVGLSKGLLDVLPKRLSGGQRQRVAIARSLAAEPAVLVADEAVSALDVSVKAGILNLLSDLKTDLGLTLVLITHDLATVRHACDNVAVMYLGRLVEVGPAEQVMTRPAHPYTRALLDAIPHVHRTAPLPPPLVGEPPSPLAPPTGCAFRTRCPVAQEGCAEHRPEPSEVSAGHSAACHFPLRHT